MKIVGTLWLRDVVDKLLWKHRVRTEEVEDVLGGRPRIRHVERGTVEGEDLFAAFGQTQAGRYLTVFFIYKATREALIVSARDMTLKERQSYGRK